MRPLVRLLILAALVTPTLPAINVKVTRVDEKKGRVTLLLPMHSMPVESAVLPKGEKVRLEKHSFYEGRIDRNAEQHRQRNVIRINGSDGKPSRFEIKKLTFVGR